MNKITSLILIISSLISGCGNSKNENQVSENKALLPCSDECMAKSKTGELKCKLTSVELQKRREGVLAHLKEKIMERKELRNGYAFKFSGSDDIIDELTAFIKTERECCDFFTFSLSVSGDKSEAWLSLTGEKGVKDFIAAELGL